MMLYAFCCSLKVSYVLIISVNATKIALISRIAGLMILNDDDDSSFIHTLSTSD